MKDMPINSTEEEKYLTKSKKKMWDPCREIHLSCFDKGTGNEKLHTPP